MTHVVVPYCASLYEDFPEQVRDVFIGGIRRLSLGTWQSAWMAYGVRSIDPTHFGVHQREMLTFLQKLAAVDDDDLATVEGVLTLAAWGAAEIDMIEKRLRTAPEDYQPAYLFGLSTLYGRDNELDKRLKAIGAAYPFGRILVENATQWAP